MANYDVVIIGSGPGGYVAAIRAASLGLKVAIVEKDHLGGVCLNWGCIPTKSLLRCSEIYHNLSNLDEFGISVKGMSFDLKKIVKRSREKADQLSKGISGLLAKHKVEVIEGTGKIFSAGKVSVNLNSGENKQLETKNIIIATGARARVIPGFEPDNKLVWTYKEAMVPEEMPKSVVVIGSGAIGIEYASFYRSMGAEVSVLEAESNILPVEDEEISKFAAKSFKSQGIEIYNNAKAKSLDKGKNEATVHFDHNGKEKTIEADKIISAVGIVANTEELGLEHTKIELDRGHIVTDENCQTAEKGIYAIGDVTGVPWLAHKASHEGIACVSKIAGVDSHGLDKNNVPSCTYSYPQIASVGYTEKAAKSAGYEINVGRFPFKANGKALAMGEPEGLVKTIFDKNSGELLGAHMVGAEVTELIQGYLVAKTCEATEIELMNTIFPHPTLSEMLHESVLEAFGKAIHI
jgi:dihydrolipoamide dehydrogenase